MANCIFTNCPIEAYDDKKVCILHCDKREYEIDKNDGFLDLFYNKLLFYLQYFIKNSILGNETQIAPHIETFLQGKNIQDAKIMYSLSSILKNNCITFESLKFPDRKSKDTFDYISIIKKLQKIKFQQCEFYTSEFDLRNSELLFHECIFHNSWILYNHKLLTENDIEKSNVIYRTCTFKEDVSSKYKHYERPEFDNSLFSNCKFE